MVRKKLELFAFQAWLFQDQKNNALHRRHFWWVLATAQSCDDPSPCTYTGVTTTTFAFQSISLFLSLFLILPILMFELFSLLATAGLAAGEDLNWLVMADWGGVITSPYTTPGEYVHIATLPPSLLPPPIPPPHLDS